MLFFHSLLPGLLPYCLTPPSYLKLIVTHDIKAKIGRIKTILWVKLITYNPQAAKYMLILFLKEI